MSDRGYGVFDLDSTNQLEGFSVFTPTLPVPTSGIELAELDNRSIAKVLVELDILSTLHHISEPDSLRVFQFRLADHLGTRMENINREMELIDRRVLIAEVIAALSGNIPRPR